MAENKIELKSVKELNGKKFIVPNYQRGYKWREKDVEYLITDIADIADDDNSDYCLQPIVVAPIEEEKCPHCGQKINNGRCGYILVDGQQRLTTIWLIINWAKHKGYNVDWNFSISYDTRNESNTYLKGIYENGFSNDSGTCDTHYFSSAINTIEKEKVNLERFFKNLVKNVKVIWYEIDDKEGPAHFERLNNAKIGLTNAELVKAFILTNSSQDIRARMACEWDEMEYMLHDDKFFSFITTKDSVYNNEYNRIELLLDLYAGTTIADKERDEYYTFNHITDKKNISVIWQEIQSIYNRLQCWHNDNFLYNLIGFLVEKNGDGEIAIIWKNSKSKSILDIKEYIRDRVVKNVPTEEDIRTMVYEDGRTKNVLLLFNILSLMSILPKPKNYEYKYVFNDKFHFDLYKKENWDKEHVHATASQVLQSKIEWVNWLKDLEEEDLNETEVSKKLGEHKAEYLEWIKKAKKINSKEDYNNIEDDKNEDFKSLTKEFFTKMFKDIVTALEGDGDDYDIKQNSIGNIVLLNARINRSGAYKVAPFSTKRRIIMERVKKGQFVPLGTQNVFMKVYTSKPGRFYKWEKDEAYDGNGKSDRDCYIDAIIETINRIK